MHASVEMLRGRGTAYAGPITRRISTTSLQNPKFFRPELRSGLKQRQEAAMRDRMQDKKKRWDDWEQQMEEEERLRREQRQQQQTTSPASLIVVNIGVFPLYPKFMSIKFTIFFNMQGRRVAPIIRSDPIQQRPQPQEQYQRAYQESENARRTKEQQLDDIQKRLQERVKQRQRRTDRWIPPQYAEDAVSQRAKQEQARAAAREARRQQVEERVRREASDAAVAAQFLQGRVRQKASRFADLVESLQESKQNKDPYRSRREDDVTTLQMSEQQRQQRRQDRRRRQQEDVVENSPYTTNYNRNNDRYDPGKSYSNLPPDVVRVQRGTASSSQVVAEIIVESDGEEPLMVWTAGSEGLFQQPMRTTTLEEAEYTDIDVEEYTMEEEEKERRFQQQQQQQRGDQQGGTAAKVLRKEFSSNSADEYIDW